MSRPTSWLRALHPRVLFALLAVYLIWSSTYLVLQVMVRDVPPMLTSGVRFFTAGALLYAYVRYRGQAAPTARQWLLSLLTGTLMFLVGNGFVALASRHLPSGVLAMSVGSMPLFLAAMEAALGQRLPPRQWLGLALGFAGVASMGVVDAQHAPLAALLLVLAPLGWALGSLCVRRLDMPKGMMAAAAQMICAGVVMGALGVGMGERFTVWPTPRTWLAFAYLVFLGSIVAFSACLFLLRETSGPLATSYAYVNPLLGAALGALVAGERLSTELLASGLLVVLGVATLLTSTSTPRTASTTSKS